MSEGEIEAEVLKINLTRPNENLNKNFSQKYIQSGMGVVNGTDIMAINHHASYFDLEEEGQISPNYRDPHYISQAYSFLNSHSQLAPYSVKMKKKK